MFFSCASFYLEQQEGSKSRFQEYLLFYPGSHREMNICSPDFTTYFNIKELNTCKANGKEDKYRGSQETWDFDFFTYL